MRARNPAIIIAVVAAILILVGRIGRLTPVLIAGFVVLVLAAGVQFIRTR